MLKYQRIAGEGELDLIFQALGDPTRRAIVQRLSTGPASVSQIAAPLPMSLPAVYQHLQVLEASGVIRSEKVGRVRTCHLELKMLNSAQTWIEARKAMWEKRLDRLETLLNSLPPEAPGPTTPTKGNPR